MKSKRTRRKPYKPSLKAYTYPNYLKHLDEDLTQIKSYSIFQAWFYSRKSTKFITQNGAMHSRNSRDRIYTPSQAKRKFPEYFV